MGWAPGLGRHLRAVCCFRDVHVEEGMNRQQLMRKLREHRWLRGGGSGGAMIRWKRLAAEISSEIGAELQLG